MANSMNMSGMTFALTKRSSTKLPEDSQVSGTHRSRKYLPTSADTFAAWIARVKALTPEQRRKFLAHSRADLGEYMEEFEEIAKKKAESSKAHKVAKFVKPLYELCRVLVPVASDNWLSQMDPTHSSLVLGGVASVLSFSGKFLDYYDKVIECLSIMLEKLQVVERFEILYSKHEGVRKAAVQVCEDILEFCVEASKLFLDEKGDLKSSSKLFKTSIVSSFDAKFGSLQKKFEHHHADFVWSINLALGELLGRVATDQELRTLKDEERYRGEILCSYYVLFERSILLIGSYVQRIAEGRFCSHFRQLLSKGCKTIE
jgi:hypothetical protein